MSDSIALPTVAPALAGSGRMKAKITMKMIDHHNHRGMRPSVPGRAGQHHYRLLSKRSARCPQGSSLIHSWRSYARAIGLNPMCHLVRFRRSTHYERVVPAQMPVMATYLARHVLVVAFAQVRACDMLVP